MSALLGLWSWRAFSFPEMTRKGYASCTSCHVAPGGGGVLNAYGQMISRTALPTFTDESERQVYDHVLVGGNARYLTVTVKNPEGERHAQFPMETEGELALTWRGLTVDGAVGTYGPLEVQDYRRAFVMASFLKDQLKLRIGRFLPSFGTLEVDHTVWTRKALGLGQGGEKTTAEAAYISRFGEVIIGRTLGQSFITKEPEDAATYVRLQAYTSERTQAGVSAKVEDSGVKALALQWTVAANDHLYSIGEINRTSESLTTSYEKVGLEIYRGLHVSLTHEYQQNNATRVGAAIQWFPVPGIDILARYRKTLERDDELAAVVHLFL